MSGEAWLIQGILRGSEVYLTAGMGSKEEYWCGLDDDVTLYWDNAWDAMCFLWATRNCYPDTIENPRIVRIRLC